MLDITGLSAVVGHTYQFSIAILINLFAVIDYFQFSFCKKMDQNDK